MNAWDFARVKKFVKKRIFLNGELSFFLQEAQVEPESLSEGRTQEAEQSPPCQSEVSARSTSGRKVNKFRQREALMSRANSLKKAVRQIIEHAEKTLDEQNASHNHKIVVVRPMSLTVQQQASKDNPNSPDDEGAAATGSDKAAQDDEESNLGRDSRVVDGGTSSSAAGATSLPVPTYSNQCAGSTVSPFDPNVTLPVPSLFGDQARKLSNASTNASTISAEDLEDEVAEILQDNKNDIPLIDGSDNSDEVEQAGEGKTHVDPESVEVQMDVDLKVDFPKIEVESPSSSVRSPKDSDDSVIEPDYDASIGHDSSCASNNKSSDLSSPLPAEGTVAVGAADGAGGLLAVPGSKAFPRGASPRGSRRISMGSLLKPLEVEIPMSPKSCKGDASDGISYSSAANSPFSSSAHSSPNKSSSQHAKRKTLPIVNPLVSHPAWPAVASGGVVSKVLLANADTICAVASPLMDPDIDDDQIVRSLFCKICTYLYVNPFR